MMDAKIVTAEEVKVQIETLQGPQGERGAQGPQGERGERGPQGIQGPAGARGEKGDRGERGEKGATGERGPQGLPGRDGADGRDGAAGARGPQGAQGLQGERGEPGPAGRDGVDGIQGFSPIVDLERLDDGVLITVQNKDGNKIARVFDGKNAENKLEDIFIIHFNEYVNASQEPIEEIINAIDAGKVVIGVTPSGVIYEYAGLKTYINKASETAHTFQAHVDPFNRNAVSRFTQIMTDNSGFVSSGQNISAKNPYKLILSGAVKAEYDGSKQISVTIPEGGTGGELFIVRYDPATKLADKTQAEIRAAVAQKTPCIALDSAGRVYSYVGEEPYHKDKNVLVPTFRHAMDYDEAGNVSFKELQIPGSGEMSIWGNTKVKAPNPKTLWIKGSGISALYDGSEQVTITLPEGGEGSGGLPEGGEPHQMLVTDGEGNAKWEERTHYVEEVEADIYPETTVAGEEGQFVVAEPYAFYPTVGGTYTVTFVSRETTTSYNCVATEFDLEGLPTVALGNIGALTGGGDTGEPFVLFFIQEDVASGAGMYALIMLLSGADTEITFSVSGMVESVHMIDEKYIPKFGASSLANGSGLGSVRNFFGYVEDETYQMGDYAFSWRGRATGETSLAWSGTASGFKSVSFGEEASGDDSFAANVSYATGLQSFATNNGKASGNQSFAEGFSTEAKGDRSHAEGYMTIAASGSQHVQGAFNIEDTADKYAHIVGNGTNNARSNAHTLDWDGNGWYAGSLYVGGTSQDDASKVLTEGDIDSVVDAAVDTALAEAKASGEFKGDKGDPGATGATGPAGYTPVKGTDYYTAADKSEMVSLVLAALPTWGGGSY